MYPQTEKTKSIDRYLFPLQSFDLQNFKTITTILSRDSGDETCRYALIRRGRGNHAEYQHLKQENGDRAFVPAGAACREMAAVLMSDMADLEKT